jgi:ATP-dependent helicase/nuclease subunit A
MGGNGFISGLILLILPGNGKTPYNAPMSLQAADPRINATLTASAGSGKTWMLVTRMLRLLLDGAEPGGILALTFTRKAAGEMQQRLAERLYQLATVDAAQLDRELEMLGISASDDIRARARRLYEFHQYCDYPVRTQTFHSFCQDLLARFPLEASVPPGFELLESSSLLIRQARDALFNGAALDMQGQVASNLQALMNACGGLFNLDKALHSFLHHRSDWWAYTEHSDDPCGMATENLRQQLDITPEQDPLGNFFSNRNLQAITDFARLLAATGGKTNLQHADTLAMLLAEDSRDLHSFRHISRCFLTLKDTPIVSGRKDSKSLRQKLKDDADQFLELAEVLPARVLATRDLINRHSTFELNRLWYLCGEDFVSHYQQLKQQLRLLDFTDLEWCSYRLLQSSDNALWVQYKLDQRIDHLLVDEFQDTNPTQWQLLLPLLQEMAAGEAERPRSVFLVGDEKQSIYGFRRAKPELQAQASHWLQQHLGARPFPLNKSWRSSPAIIDTVNQIFSQDAYRQRLPGFSEHATHRETLPGRVEVFPLFRAGKDPLEDADEIRLRNPLQQPRVDEASIYLQEGQLIADTIRQLIDQRITIGEGDQAHPIDYDDIYILVRKRSHLADYEQALRQAGIPYLGANRGTLLDCIEIQDMEALLDTLLTPFNNLALAQVLKSPLFGVSDDHLMRIAGHHPSKLWIDRIAELSEQLPADHPIRRAHESIQQWRQLVDRIPVHDLLDKIYSQADILRRYRAATPPSLQPRVQANLSRFLELALELDSGRYPSLTHFLHHIRSLKTLASDAPDEAPMEIAESRVKIMTIHASKGLEAAVVFLADSISTGRDRSSISTLVDWPVEQPRPQWFQLIPPKEQRDSVSAQLLEQQQQVQQREDAHLLYVAITRAKQLLYVSGCLAARGPYLDWHTPVLQALRALHGVADEDAGDTEHLVYSHRNLNSWTDTDSAMAADHAADETPDIDPRLFGDIQLNRPAEILIAPSKTVQAHDIIDGDEDGQIRGLAMHRCLELLTRKQAFSIQAIRQSLCEDLQLAPTEPLIDDCLQEAQRLIGDPTLAHIFTPAEHVRVYNECPIHFQLDQQLVYGVIDRLLLSEQEALIIDYKSHSQARPDNVAQLAAAYQQQMALYAAGISKAWPGKQVKAALLFTRCGYLQPVDVT